MDYATFVRFLYEGGLIVLKIVGIVFVISTLYFYGIATILTIVRMVRDRMGKSDMPAGDA